MPCPIRLAVVLCAATLPAPPVRADPTPPPGQVGTLVLAARLYAHALAHDDALSAVAAFRLASGVSLRPAQGWEKTTADAGALAGAAPAGANARPTGGSALALVTGQTEAATREIAAGDEDLSALVADAAAETARGRIGGANQQVAALVPGKKDIWQIPFAGQDRAEIGLFGDGSGGLGWMVTDADGRTVCLDPYAEDSLYCAFTPRENAFYTVTVISRSKVQGHYLLATD